MNIKKTALVTGATDGIGLETAAELGRRGWTVVLHGRAETSARRAVEALSAQIPGEWLPVWGDFSSLQEVESLARQVGEHTGTLDVLINNAGLKVPTRQVSADGFELTWAVNHLAPFLLTARLKPLLSRPEARIITVSSMAHRRGSLAWEDLNGERDWDSYRAYAQSKLANLMMTLSLARRAGSSGPVSHGVHPGAVTTKLLVKGFGASGNPVASGAAPTVMAATTPAWGQPGGRYLGPGGPEDPSASARDQEAQDRLWAVSLQQTGLEESS